MLGILGSSDAVPQQATAVNGVDTNELLLNILGNSDQILTTTQDTPGIYSIISIVPSSLPKALTFQNSRIKVYYFLSEWELFGLPTRNDVISAK